MSVTVVETVLAESGAAEDPVTISTPNAGDLIVALHTHRNATPPTLPTGFTSAVSQDSTASSGLISYRVSDGTETQVAGQTQNDSRAAITVVVLRGNFDTESLVAASASERSDASDFTSFTASLPSTPATPVAALYLAIHRSSHSGYSSEHPQPDPPWERLTARPGASHAHATGFAEYAADTPVSVTEAWSGTEHNAWALVAFTLTDDDPPPPTGAVFRTAAGGVLRGAAGLLRP